MYKYIFFIIFQLFIISTPATAKGLIYGIGGHPEGFNGTDNEYVNLLKKYNMQSLRTDYLWAEVENNKNIFNPPNAKTESVINRAYQNSISSLLILGYGNKLYGTGKPITAEQLLAFKKYVSWTVRHFKGRHYIYEIWNEWSHHSNGNVEPVGYRSAVEYVALVRQASLVIRSIDPTATVIAGGFNPIDGAESGWGLQLIKLGVLKYVDGISIHPYAYSSKHLAEPDFNLQFVSHFYKRATQISNKMDIDFYITEIGYPTYNGGANFSQYDVECYVSEYFNKISKMPYIKGVWWYDLKDDGDDKKNKEHNFGILDSKLNKKAVANFFLDRNKK